jgi:ADP-ribosylglycohydrolase
VITRYRASYEAALWATVSGMGDRDTTCAIVGGMLASDAEMRIPEDWVSRVEPFPG